MVTDELADNCTVVDATTGKVVEVFLNRIRVFDLFKLRPWIWDVMTGRPSVHLGKHLKYKDSPMTTERLAELKAITDWGGLVADEGKELVEEIERLRGLEENRTRVHAAACEGAAGLKTPEA